MEGYVCPECGSFTRAGRTTCDRCHLDLSTAIESGRIEEAHTARFIRREFVREPSSYTQRPRDVLEFAESAFRLGDFRSAIDVGCGPNLIARAFESSYPHIVWEGFDQFPTSESIKKIDLENARLPFADGSIDLAVCSHVLEHVDNMHALTNELFRVAKAVVILLPNSLLWTTLAKVVLGRSILPINGLPLGRPLDRHRWIYTVKEADRWAMHLAGRAHRSVVARYRVDMRVPCLAGRVAPSLFVTELTYGFVDAP